MAWLGIEPATTRSRVRRANHSATLPLTNVTDRQMSQKQTSRGKKDKREVGKRKTELGR